MKTSRVSKIRGIVFLAAVLIALSEIAPAREDSSGSLSVKDLPPIVLEKCIEVQKLIGRNPFSHLPNDYLLVTQYEEKAEEAGAMKKGPIPGSALNLYLLQGFLVLENRHISIVHDSVLIVKVSTTVAKTSGETVREWILIDENGDQNVDRGIFRETVRGTGKGPSASNESAISRDHIQELQAYYEKAAVALETRAEEGLGDGCVIT